MLNNQFKRFLVVYQKEIWQPAYLKDRSLRGRFYALLRVISITWSGLGEVNVGSRAAALSYSSLLGLGPLIAIAVLVSGMVLNQGNPDLAVDTLNKVIKFIAPQVSQYEQIEQSKTGTISAQVTPPGAAAETAKPEVKLVANAGLGQLINSFAKGSRSSAAGVAGALTLIVIVIQLFTSIETTFNAIWGVRRGRSWLMRIVFYWTVVTLGAVLFFAALTALSAGTFIHVFMGKLPFSAELFAVTRWMPSLSFLILILILGLFYRTIPNTHVFWSAALVGALVVTSLLFLNNYLAFLYFRRVLISKSLFGSLGILPILMIGLYFFWFFVIVGGQVSYAVQNVHFRSSQAAWHNLNAITRESLSLLVLLFICRRFKQCQPPFTASQLGDNIKVPTQILNECLNRLVDLRLITSIPPAEGQATLEHRYQPARPLNRITLLEFKGLFENYGEAPSSDSLEILDPVLKFYREHIANNDRAAFGNHTVDTLLEEFAPVKPVVRAEA